MFVEYYMLVGYLGTDRLFLSFCLWRLINGVRAEGMVNYLPTHDQECQIDSTKITKKTEVGITEEKKEKFKDTYLLRTLPTFEFFPRYQP